MPEQFDAAYWEARHGAHGMLGEHEPNPWLVAEAGGLIPGTALEAGCGQGTNAIWLAERGWRVTAVDVSPTALDRAREHAERRGADVAKRVDWVRGDLTEWPMPAEHFGLVTAHYVHPTGSHQQLLARLAAAVAPGGTLLVVDHGPSDEHAHVHTTVDDLAAALDPRTWRVEVAETRVRQGSHDHGTALHDVVLLARRRG